MLLKELLEKNRLTALEDEEKRFQSRHGDLSQLIVDNTLAKMEREIEKTRQFFPQMVEELKDYLEDKEAEVQRRKEHYEEMRQQLENERERVLKRVIPNRFSLDGDAMVFPLAFEVRFPIG